MKLFLALNISHVFTSRSPRGERGLKLNIGKAVLYLPQSLPSRGAWIEIYYLLRRLNDKLSLPSRGAWIEIRNYAGSVGWFGSLPSRGAWIEIRADSFEKARTAVAPLAGSVD